MKIAVIADEDTVLGFAYAGVRGTVVTTPEETQQAFEEMTHTKDMGILLMTERVARMIRTTVDQWIIAGGHPLVVEIPDRDGPLEDRRTPHEFVKSAIGVKF